MCLQELELAIDDERRAADEARQAVTVLERKRIALQTELEDVRSLLETVSTVQYTRFMLNKYYYNNVTMYDSNPF